MGFFSFLVHFWWFFSKSERKRLIKSLDQIYGSPGTYYASVEFQFWFSCARLSIFAFSPKSIKYWKILILALFNIGIRYFFLPILIFVTFFGWYWYLIFVTFSAQYWYWIFDTLIWYCLIVWSYPGYLLDISQKPRSRPPQSTSSITSSILSMISLWWWLWWLSSWWFWCNFLSSLWWAWFEWWFWCWEWSSDDWAKWNRFELPLERFSWWDRSKVRDETGS